MEEDVEGLNTTKEEKQEAEVAKESRVFAKEDNEGEEDKQGVTKDSCVIVLPAFGPNSAYRNNLNAWATYRCECGASSWRLSDRLAESGFISDITNAALGVSQQKRRSAAEAPSLSSQTDLSALQDGSSIGGTPRMEEVEVETEMETEHKVVVKWSDLSKHVSLLAPFQRGAGQSLFKQWIRDNIRKKECCLYSSDGGR